MDSLDTSITKAINAVAGASPYVDSVVIAVSAYGVPLLVGLVAVQWWRRQERPLVRHALLSAGFAFLLGLGINQFILLVFDRTRPYDEGVTKLIIAPSADPSFPSDHATAAMAIAASLLLFRNTRAQGGLFLLAACLISLSRVFIGIHYASDVIGGALIGALAAFVVFILFRPGSRLSRLAVSIF